MEISALYQLYQAHPNIQTDSRKIKPGDIYVALRGENFNGNSFAAQALASGAAYVIVDEDINEDNDKIIRVTEGLATLQALAKYHRATLNIPVIAITGTNGKTTTKELIHCVLSEKFKTHATKGNLNNHIGVPLTLLSMPPETEIAIIEMGANHEKEIESYCVIAMPNYGIINNVGKAHLEGFGSLEGVRRAKGELYDYIRTTGGSVFINNDLDYLREMASDIDQRITYGTTNAQIIAKALATEGLLKFALLSSGIETIIQTQLIGDYNLPNALAAVCIGHHFGVDIDTIKNALEKYQPTNSRSQLLQKGTNTIVLDAYNANPSSMKLALENLAKIPSDKTKWLLLGAMKEMGENSNVEHQNLIDLALNLGFKHALLVGDEFEGTQHPFVQFSKSESALQWLQQAPLQNAFILIKGSRGAKMETVLPAFG